MRSTQVTTWCRFTAAEKKAYRARVRRRQVPSWLAERRILMQREPMTGVNFLVQSDHPINRRVNGERL